MQMNVHGLLRMLEGYGSTSQDVLIPSFLAAYSKVPMIFLFLGYLLITSFIVITLGHKENEIYKVMFMFLFLLQYF